METPVEIDKLGALLGDPEVLKAHIERKATEGALLRKASNSLAALHGFRKLSEKPATLVVPIVMQESGTDMWRAVLKLPCKSYEGRYAILDNLGTAVPELLPKVYVYHKHGVLCGVFERLSDAKGFLWLLNEEPAVFEQITTANNSEDTENPTEPVLPQELRSRMLELHKEVVDWDMKG